MCNDVFVKRSPNKGLDYFAVVACDERLGLKIGFGRTNALVIRAICRKARRLNTIRTGRLPSSAYLLGRIPPPFEIVIDKAIAVVIAPIRKLCAHWAH